MEQFFHTLKFQWFVEGKYDNHYGSLKIPNASGLLILASFALTIWELWQRKVTP